MNKQRRKQLSAIIDEIEALRGKLSDLETLVVGIKEDLEPLRDEEQESFDNLPESLQSGERGQDMEEAISNLDSAIDAIDTLACSIQDFDFDEVISSIDNARGPE